MEQKKKRAFKPRKIIPKQQLIEYLKMGLTLEEIGQEIGKSRSYISELLNLHGIKADEIEGRKYAMKQRKKMLESRPFVNVMYDRIKNEKWGAKMPILNPQPYYKRYKIEDIEEIAFYVPHNRLVRVTEDGTTIFANRSIAIKEKKKWGV